MIAKTMQKLHFANPELFNFTFRNDGQPYDEAGYRALLFTLPAVAGLAGATLRIPNSFMIAICGGRNVKFMTTVMLIIPALAAGIAMQNPTPRSMGLHHSRGHVGRGRRRVRFEHVEHLVLLSQNECRDSHWG